MGRAVLVAILLLAALPGSASAACDTEGDATPASACVVMERDGQRGVWLRMSEADALRRLRLEVPELRLQVERLGMVAEIQTERVAAYREAGELRRDALAQSRIQLEASLGREHHLWTRLHAWSRSPAFWLAMGIVITAVGLVALVVALPNR